MRRKHMPVWVWRQAQLGFALSGPGAMTAQLDLPQSSQWVTRRAKRTLGVL